MNSINFKANIIFALLFFRYALICQVFENFNKRLMNCFVVPWTLRLILTQC